MRPDLVVSRCSTMTASKRCPDASTLRELAVRGGVDPRTLRKLMAGKPVRGMAGRRAANALVQAGYLPPEHGGSTPSVGAPSRRKL